MIVIEVISQLTKFLKTRVSYTDLGKVLGLSRQRISQLKEKHLSDEQIAKVEQHFNVNLTNTKYKEEIKLVEISILGEIPDSGKKFVYLDNGEFVYPISNKFLEQLNIDIQNAKMFFTKGDAMSPIIENGDFLLVDTSKKEISDGKIYCIKIENELCIRQLQKIPPDKIKISAENPKYEPIYHNFTANNFNFEIIGETSMLNRVIN